MKKNLQNWLHEGRLQQHNTSVKEIADLFKVVDRDLADAAIKEISADRRFATAYNAALQLATIVLYASGYRAGVVSDTTADEILEEAKAFRVKAIDWLKANHPELLKGP
jgi:hypothetical protein